MRNCFENTLIALFFSLWLFAVVSVPCIDETCLGCGHRECPYGIAVDLRKLSVIEWALDSTGDIHSNGLCPTQFVINNRSK